MTEKSDIIKLPHHVQENLCYTRPAYRQGKKLTSVKVYTVNDESQHLIICGVPKLNLNQEVSKLVSPYGDVKELSVVPNYPAEEFTETFHVKYGRIQNARIAKRLLDGKNFFGGILHVFYAPELESISETRTKLISRRRDVTLRIKKNQQDTLNPQISKYVPPEQYHRKLRTPALPLTEDRLAKTFPGETMQSIYNGIPQMLDKRQVLEPSLPSHSKKEIGNSAALANDFSSPYQPNEPLLYTSSDTKNKNRKRNYKGQNVEKSVKIVRPQIIDTRNLMKWPENEDKTVFSNVKKVKNSITIKLAPKNQETKKIKINNPSVTRLVEPSERLQEAIICVKSNIRASMQKNK